MVNYLHFEPVKAGNDSPNNQKFADKLKLGSGNLNKIKSIRIFENSQVINLFD